ncbi:FhaA domain-containing protein [Streptomyces sp. NPDC058818]|uniref:FhaA domain-containing protein n=1 Tax=Streptomyces sp. NPDC058818 TaxID=3346640 RepID=UPI00368E3A1C
MRWLPLQRTRSRRNPRTKYTHAGEPAQSAVGQAPPMGFLGTSERLMEQWTTSMWRHMLPARQEQGEALTTLLRQCDDNTLIVGRQRVVAPNAFGIELLPRIHRLIAASPLPVAPALAGQVRRHAAEQGYTFAGPIAIDLCPASDDTAVRFRVHSRIAPARGREA